MKPEKPKERKIHVALPEEVHQRLRVKCALEDVTIQQYVVELLAENLKHVKLSLTARNTTSVRQ